MLSNDLRFAIRGLWKRPGFSLFAIGVMAAGVGAATAIFSYADAILFKPIEMPDADRTVTLTQVTREHGFEPVTAARFREWQSGSAVFTEMAGWSYGAGTFNLTGSGFAERVRGLHVTASHFVFFGARMVAGRAFGGEEEGVAVITQRFLRPRFESTSAALGQKLVLNQKPYVITGVLGEEGPLARDSTEV